MQLPQKRLRHMKTLEGIPDKMVHNVKMCLSVLALSAMGGCATPGSQRPAPSVVTLLTLGPSGGGVPISRTKEYGDFGLGVWGDMQGEMVVLDGTIYQVASDGRALATTSLCRDVTPFAVVVVLRTDRAACGVVSVENQAELRKVLDAAVPSKNEIVAARIEGQFRSIKLSSVPVATLPSSRPAGEVDGPAVREYRGIKGTLVAFRFPVPADQESGPGWHIHFLSADRAAGGHVLEADTESFCLEAALYGHLQIIDNFGATSARPVLPDKMADELRRAQR
jgi:acetolactate decarboxylase